MAEPGGGVWPLCAAAKTAGTLKAESSKAVTIFFISILPEGGIHSFTIPDGETWPDSKMLLASRRDKNSRKLGRGGFRLLSVDPGI